MKSMTGYGRGVATRNNRTVTVELKSVNNRFLEVACKLPKSLMYIDDTIQKAVKSSLSRGSVDVYFSYDNKSETSKKVEIDHNLAEQYVTAAKELRAEFRLEGDFNVTALLRTPDVVSVTVPDDDRDEVVALTKLAVGEALEKLDQMRLVEGKSIYDDLTRLVDNLQGYLDLAIKRAPLVVSEYKENLRTRIKELMDGTDPDEARIITEAAFFADKADINEEISRLGSHISQFRAICGETGVSLGRRLDFLSQEMVREVNTMGSKSNDVTLTGYVVAMKNEVEKIKEQIRNVE